jgi:hypothetical protein
MSPCLLAGHKNEREDKRGIHYIYRNSLHFVHQETRRPDRNIENLKLMKIVLNAVT